MQSSKDLPGDTFAMNIQDGIPVPAKPEDAAEVAAPGTVNRAFFRGDYKRLVHALRKARTGRNGQLKPAAVQDVITHTATVLTYILAQDCPGFDSERFIAGTMVVNHVPSAAASDTTVTAHEDDFDWD